MVGAVSFIRDQIITVDVYGDKRNIIADCVDELQPFLDEVLPDRNEKPDTSGEEFLIDPEEFME